MILDSRPNCDKGRFSNYLPIDAEYCMAKAEWEVLGNAYSLGSRSFIRIHACDMHLGYLLTKANINDGTIVNLFKALY